MSWPDDGRRQVVRIDLDDARSSIFPLCLSSHWSLCRMRPEEYDVFSFPPNVISLQLSADTKPGRSVSVSTDLQMQGLKSVTDWRG